MSLADLSSLNLLVLACAFGLAVAFGAASQASHFCTMGAIADVVAFGSWTRASMWLAATGTAMVGFGGLVGVGLVDPAATMHTAPRLLWASTGVGGLCFGVGMVLASGCGGKTLVRIGAGNLKSLVVFAVMALAALATLRGLTAVLRVRTLDTLALPLPVGQDLPSWLALASGLPRASWAAGLGVVLGALLWRLAWRRASAPWRDWLPGGLAVGALVSAMWWLSGHLAHVAEHPETLEAVYLGSNSRGMESFSFVGPAAYLVDWMIMFSDQSKVLSMGVVIPLGMVLGSALVAVSNGTFRWEGFAGAEDTALHLVGAVLMGVGGVTALGCSIGQGVTGLSTLSIGSALATTGIVVGARAALRWQIRRLERQA